MRLSSLINTAIVAFASPPAFVRHAPSQPDFATAIAKVVQELPRVINVAGKKKVMEWGAPGGIRMKSGETWHKSA